MIKLMSLLVVLGSLNAYAGSFYAKSPQGKLIQLSGKESKAYKGKMINPALNDGVVVIRLRASEDENSSTLGHLWIREEILMQHNHTVSSFDELIYSGEVDVTCEGATILHHGYVGDLLCADIKISKAANADDF